MSSNALDMARRMLIAKLEEVIAEARNTQASVAGATELRNLMFDLIEERIEKRLRTRRLLEESAGLAL
jgi:hypothetical protein